MSRELLGPQHVGSAEPVIAHPTIQVMTERLAAGSGRGEREDAHIVALAIEGGGVAGAVSAGMCVALESAGLIDTVDRIYGTSSGALNGSYTAAGQGALGATNYADIMVPGFVRHRHILQRQSVLNFDYLFNEVIKQRKPYDEAGLARGPEFAALSVNLESLEVEVLKDFEDVDDLMLAVRTSCAMPIMSGPPIEYRGATRVDGALLASVPFRAALDEGATHVLALRSRGENYRKVPYSRANILATRYLPFGGTALAKLVAARPELYNQDAEELQHGGSAAVVQITPEGPDTPVEQLEKSHAKMRAGFYLGATAVTAAFGMPAVEVIWGDTFPRVTAAPVLVTAAAA